MILSQMEHHANIVPWQMIAEEKGLRVKVAPINHDGSLNRKELSNLLSDETSKVLSLCHISNSLGTINPIEEIISEAHEHGVHVVVDGAQSVPHTILDLKKMDCDFFAFSGHKVFGPMGIGVLYGKKELLAEMPPYQGGGDMIDVVSFEKTTYNTLPHKFEAGTPHIAGVIALKEAIDYLSSIGLEKIAAYEHDLLDYATAKLKAIEGIKLIGTAKEKSSVLSFTLTGAHPHDIGTLLDRQGIAIRTGHHCNQPLMKRLGVPATARASFSFYNTTEEVDHFIKAIEKTKEFL